MILGITYTTESLYDEATAYFSPNYVKQTLKKPFLKESLIGRLEISKAIGNNYVPEEIDGIPSMYDENFWSLSHKEGIVFFWTWNNNIGVDLEIVKKRDISVLETFSEEEYRKLQGKNWENFYRLWTMYESMIKYDREKLYSDGMYRLVSYKNCNTEIWWIVFDSESHFLREGRDYRVLSGIRDNILYSICR